MEASIHHSHLLVLWIEGKGFPVDQLLHLLLSQGILLKVEAEGDAGGLITYVVQ